MSERTRIRASADSNAHCCAGETQSICASLASSKKAEAVPSSERSSTGFAPARSVSSYSAWTSGSATAPLVMKKVWPSFSSSE